MASFCSDPEHHVFGDYNVHFPWDEGEIPLDGCFVSHQHCYLGYGGDYLVENDGHLGGERVQSTLKLE